MLSLKWTGKAYGKNQKSGYNSKTGQHFKNAYYKAFQDGMALLFRAQAKGKTFDFPDVIICADIGPTMDHHNLIEPVMDALQMSGVIANDRNVGWVKCAPAERHPAGQDDEIIVLLLGE
jgi:hypothetical protein